MERSPADYRREARETLAGPPDVSTDMQIPALLTTRGGGVSSIDIGGLAGLAGGPGPGGPGPPDAGAPPGAVTSDHTGGQLDFIRTAIMALQHFAKQTNDDQELAKVHKCIVGLQSILADHASTKDKALGMTPVLQHVRRSRQGY
jgi:hypothetical protein